MKLQRLFRMGIPELAGRSRQTASKWLDRVCKAGGTNGQPDAVFATLSPSLDRVREVGADRFFEGAVSEHTPRLLAEHIPSALHHVKAAADALCEKRFDLLGYRGLSFGDPVDWHLDPISGRRACLAHWSLLDPLDPAAVGDAKVVWELNRHQWLVQLGQAYRLTGEERYARMFAASVREWMRANPPGKGINWASSLEVALRLVSWCWALFLFRNSETLSPELFANLLGGIRAHASHVERYLSYYFSPNTHLTGEALGLFYAGVLFPELRPAGRWRALGARILEQESKRQVLPDGVCFEQSTCYQRYTVEIYLHFLILASRNGLTVPTTVADLVQRMVDFLVAVRRPDGSVPQIGDADSGWLLPLARRAADDFRGIFSTAAACFHRSDYAWAAGGLAPETVWLLGVAGLQAFAAVRPSPPATETSRVFNDGGYVVMRSGWDAHAHQLIFDVGPLGCPVSAGHGHADLLSIQCSVFGEPYLVDPGTYCYTAAPEWRSFFRSTAAHSTVVVDGESQALPAGPFAWKSLPRARLHRWRSTEALDTAEATHDAYRRLPDPVLHRRRVVFVKSRYWVVVDDLAGAAEHSVELRFQFAPMDVTVGPSTWARARGRQGRGLLMRAFSTVELKAAIVEGELAPIQGWMSPEYGVRQPAPLLIYSAVARLPLRVVTLLLPVAEPTAPPPAVSPLVDEGRWPVGLVFGAGQESIRFDNRPASPAHGEGWGGDGGSVATVLGARGRAVGMERG